MTLLFGAGEQRDKHRQQYNAAESVTHGVEQHVEAVGRALSSNIHLMRGQPILRIFATNSVFEAELLLAWRVRARWFSRASSLAVGSVPWGCC